MDEFFGIGEKEILAFMEIFKIKKWNFSTAKIKKIKHFLHLLADREDTCEITEFILKNNAEKPEILLKLFSKLVSLQKLHLESIVIEKKVPELISNGLQLPVPLSLKILKLKNSFLEDSFFENLCHFSHLI